MNHGWFVLGGFMLGTAGMKMITSRPFKRVLARTTAYGLEAKDYLDYVVDEAKAQCDDIMAEAKLIQEQDKAKAEEHEEIAIEEVVAEEAAKSEKTEATKKATSTKRTNKRTSK